MVLVGALLEGGGQPHVARTHVPEEDAERVHVHAVVVVTGEQFGGHVYWRPHNAATHHGLGLAESQVRYFTTVVPVQLKVKKKIC